MIHFVQSLESQTMGLRKSIPFGKEGYACYWRGIRLGAAGISICHPSYADLKEIWPGPNWTKKRAKVNTYILTFDSGSGQILFKQGKKTIHKETREESRMNIIQKTQRKSSLLRKIYCREWEKIQKTGITMGFKKSHKIGTGIHIRWNCS